MKKFLCMVALSGFLFACNNDKKEEKQTEETTTTQPTTDVTPADVTPTDAPTTTSGDLPKFSDPEVQKFASDYAAFIKEYKAAGNNPAKLAELGKNMQDWTTRSQAIATKIAADPQEAQKWAQWWMAVSKDLYPTTTTQ